MIGLHTTFSDYLKISGTKLRTKAGSWSETIPTLITESMEILLIVVSAICWPGAFADVEVEGVVEEFDRLDPVEL